MGYYPELNLILLDAVPGQTQLSALLKGQAVAGALTLNQALTTAAHMAVRLHLSEIQLGRLRTLKSEVDDLQEACQIARQLTPALALHLQELVNRLKPYLAQPALPYCFSHGDFTHTQLIFEGTIGGLVDFDTICQAEPGPGSRSIYRLSTIGGRQSDNHRRRSRRGRRATVSVLLTNVWPDHWLCAKHSHLFTRAYPDL